MPDPEQEAEYVYVSAASAHSFATRLLTAHAMTSSHAAIVATSLLSADLRGHDTHGLLRLPSYLARVRLGSLSATAIPTLTSPTPVCHVLDAHNAFGHVAASDAMAAATTSAKTYGIGLVLVKHSNHFGAAASYIQPTVAQGLCALLFTNSSPAMPAFGGRDRLLGVSPIAAGAPGRADRGDLILDMAPSVAARGKVYKALRRGEPIPADWALDSDGRPTTDPAAALAGTMLPMAGPKGSALAVMMDVFSGVLSGSAFGGGVVGPYDANNARPADVGHFVCAIDPAVFWEDVDEFRERMAELYDKVVGGRRREGCDRIWWPGEREIVEERKRRIEGVPYTREEVETLNDEARKVGVEGVEWQKEKFGLWTEE